ncbi:MAG TPA: hypothetical protein VLN47_08715 [Clostridiaceae bacterium]|nr:hypothetical protein [Clostridiaceae bacterium]
MTGKKLVSGLILGLVLFIGTGCTSAVRGDEKTAQAHVEDRGYYVRENLGEVEAYLLEEGLLDGGEDNLVIERMWSVQDRDPREYLGKRISVYGFVVKNHLLQQTFRSPQKILVFVMLSEGVVIGGYSYPDAEQNEAFYAFDGSSSTRILRDRYVFEGGSETWEVEYVVDSKRVFTDRNGRIEYDGEANALMSVTCKRETEELGKVEKFKIAYASRFGTGSSSMEFDEAQYLDRDHTMRLSGSADQLGSVDETVRITITVDDKIEEMELHLVQDQTS